MKANGEVAVRGASLVCSFDQADWYFLLRRSDDKCEKDFMDFHEKDVYPSDVANFIPNWKNLSWKNLPNSIFSNNESIAFDGTYKINVIGREGNNKNHQDVINSFLEFMKN